MFLEVEKQARVIEAEGIKVSNLVKKAKVEGKLKKVEEGETVYWIEDPVNGDGLCEMHWNNTIY